MSPCFLIILSLIDILNSKIVNCNGGHGADVIHRLAGYTPSSSNPPIIEYSGFIEVNKTANGSLFYWLIEAQSGSKSSTPLLIWLNGGPGASSLTGLFAENGPFRIESNGHTLQYNKYTWSKYYNMLFVDNPINTGFSFCNPGHEITNEDQMGQNFRTFMQGFYACHPELTKNPLYITGESYAGRYIPFIWKHINDIYDVKGLAIGNGIYDPFIQFHSSPYYAFINGIIDYGQYQYIDEIVTGCLKNASNAAKTMDIKALNESANVCLNITNAVYEQYGGNIFQYDIRVNNPHEFDGITANIANYLGQSSVVNDIHTEGITWKSSDGTSAPNPVANALNYDIVLNNSASIIPQVLSKHTRILFYNGQFDGSIWGNIGNQACLAQFNYKGTWNGLQRKAHFTN
eukprot:478752_1